MRTWRTARPETGLLVAGGSCRFPAAWPPRKQTGFRPELREEMTPTPNDFALFPDAWWHDAKGCRDCRIPRHQ